MNDIKNYETLEKLYNDNFSTGYLNLKLSDKFVLIGLTCYLTDKLKKKKHDITHLQVLQSITKNMEIPEDFLMSLAVICTDFAYGCKEFPTFGIEPKDMKLRLQELFSMWIPF